MRRDLHQEVAQGKRTKIPAVVDGAAYRIVSNMILNAINRRDTPIVREGDYSIRINSTDAFFTRAIKEDLSHLRKKRFGMFVVGGRLE